MPLVWASLGLFLVLSTVGAVTLVRRGLAFWRDLKQALTALARGVDDLTRKAERTAVRAQALGATGARVEPGAARLSVSLARLAVLRAAVEDVQHAVGRVTAVYPRK